MSALIMDREMQDELIRRRQQLGLDGHDEVWDGVYVIPPPPNNEHQELVGAFGAILMDVIGWTRLGKVRLGVNLSKHEVDWTNDYRVPDVVVFLNETKAKNCDTHWVGTADFLIEIVSPYDQTRDMLPFYEKLGVREVLIVDRDPWQLELYQLRDGALVLAGTSTPAVTTLLASVVVPLDFRLVVGADRPRIEVAHRDGSKRWEA